MYNSPAEIRRLTRLIVATAIAAIAAIATFMVVVPPATATEPRGALAWYQGELMDLSEGWQKAQACHFGEDLTAPGHCFDTEADMDAWLAKTQTAGFAGPSAASSSCASSLRLFDGTNYSGASLNLTTRGTWLNLSSYGFDQRTSSFKVGACDSKFADYSNGGGGSYPLYLTEAHDQSSSMLSGWNNDVSSVYIY